MPFHPIDGFFLDGAPAKAAAIAAALAQRSSDERAAPFYRAFETVGERAHDDALIALRLVLAGRPADDDGVKRMRALIAAAKGGDPAARAAYLSEVGAS
jgi:cytochrome c-type biogenesis protein CcmH/NrfG